MKNAVHWFDIPASDLARAKAFYEAVFGIEMTEMTLPSGLKMALFPVEPGGVGGALAEHSEFYFPGNQGTLVYLNGDPDLQAVLDRLEASGGRVLVPKTQISPEYGHMAIFEDSEGNRVALQSAG